MAQRGAKRGQLKDIRLALAAAALLLAWPAGQPPAGSAAVDVPIVAVTAVPAGADAVTSPPPDRSAKAESPILQSQLARLYRAHLNAEQQALSTFRGQRFVDLATHTVRVVLEIDGLAVGLPTAHGPVEPVRVAGGAGVQVEHAPPVALPPDLAVAIAAAGATYETAYQDRVQVVAPIASLEALTHIAGVRLVRLPLPAQVLALPGGAQTPGPAVGTQTTQGTGLTNAAAWHAAGFDGSGIHLAVFDLGFTGWAERQAAGDLPGGAALVLHDFSAGYDFNPDTAGYAHGTSCAEVAYDMAPGSTVHLYAWSTDVEFGNAVADYAAVTGPKVASMSVGYVNAGPYDGSGSINAIVDAAQAAGVFWVNAAGNSQKAHWSGVSSRHPGTDAVAFGNGNVNAFGPAPGRVWSIAAGTVLQVFLEWNDWNAARTGNQGHIDYDLLLYRWTGSAWAAVAGSTQDQCASAVPPLEAIEYTVATAGTYGVAVWRDEGGGACPNNFGHWLELYTFNGFSQSDEGTANSFAYINACNSLAIPADGDSAVAVGATFWNDDSTPPLYGLETFSSLGPRNAAGGAGPGGAIDKPDLVAPDGVSTATDGANNGTDLAHGGGGLWGTLAAAPHVAGLAATAWSAYPAYSLAELHAYLQGQALYKGHGGACGAATGITTEYAGSAGQNNRYGWGRVHLGAPPSAPPPAGAAPQCLDGSPGLRSVPNGAAARPISISPEPAALQAPPSLAASGATPRARLTTVAVTVADHGAMQLAGEEPDAGLPHAASTDSRAAGSGPEAPLAVGRVPNIQIDGGQALPGASSYIDTAVDSSGNLYVVYEYTDGADYDLVIGKSTDNGRTWLLYLLGDGGAQRHPAIAIDAADHVYIAHDYTTGSTTYPAYFRSVTPRDVSAFTLYWWSGYNAGASHPAVATYGSGPTGTLYMVWQYWNGALDALRYFSSTDGGSTWETMRLDGSSSLQYPAIVLAPCSSQLCAILAAQASANAGDIYVWQEEVNQHYWSEKLAYTNSVAELYPALAASGAKVYLAFQKAASSTNDNLLFFSSPDGGSNWPIHDVSLAATSYNERFPSLAANGTAVRAIYAFDSGTALRLRQSTDSGSHWDSAPIVTMTDLANKVQEGLHCADVSFRVAPHPAVAWIDIRHNGLAADPFYSTLNDPPAAPTLLSPADGGTLSAFAPSLLWSAGTDADGDPVRYWWSIGTANPPSAVTGGPVARPAALPYFALPGSTFYWKVQADDGYQVVGSVARSFAAAPWAFSGSNYDEPFSSDPSPGWTSKAFACLDCFETEPVRWTASPPLAWARSGAHAWTGDYSARSLYDADNADYQLVSPPLDLRGASWAYLNTHFRGSSELGYDFLSVDTRPDAGSAWTTRARHSGDLSARWWTYFDGSLDLSGLAHTAAGQVRFRLTTDGSNHGGSYGVGWYQDDVEVSRTSEWAWQSTSPGYYRLQTSEGAWSGYTANLIDQLYSPYIAVPDNPASALELTLTERYDVGTGDQATVWIRDAAAGTWEQLAAYSGSQPEFTERTIALSDTYKGKTIALAFVLATDSSGTLAGIDEQGGYWDLDRVHLNGGPTAVDLVRFEAWPAGNAIRVEWETATEIDNLGFNLYRADTSGGDYARINDSLIPSQAPGSPVGAVYTWTDTGVVPGLTYYYQLEDIDVYGVATRHGPVWAAAGYGLYLPLVWR